LANGLYNGRTFQYTIDFEKKISELTPKQVQDAFKKVLDPKKLVVIQAGDFQKK
jgi:zinc protease